MDKKQEFLAVYESSADAVFRYCYFRVFERELALDIAQEAFVKTWQTVADGKQIDNVRAFVYRVARNLIIDHSRKKKHMSLEQLLADGGFDIAAGGPNSENMIDAKLLLSVLQTLDDQYREVVLMRYIEGLSPREIAEILQEKENTVSVRITRGIKKLKDLMGPQ